MTDYTKTTNFASKDALPSGNANKIVKGTEINTEFDNIATAVTTKANIANPAFTGVVSFPDGSASNPSITNTGDTNAGLFFSAADTLAFSAGGTAQVVFADGVISPVTDSDVDLGTNSLRFKDAYVDSVTVTGNGAITGDLDVDGTIEFDALSGTGSVAITDILDEDDMASNSATALATQQSIKAYVIAQQDTVDSLSEVLALGNTTGDTDISVTDDTKVQFRDSAIYINSSADGQLDIVADTEIQIAATTVDINGAVALNGAVTGATNVTLSGELDAATGDFSGAVDIDGALDVAGTTNLDVVDIDGATQIDATVSVGVDDTGYDVKFFGATSGKSLLWDESADSLIVTGTTTMTGNSTVSGTLGVTGVLTGTSLDISGDIDVDGTTNLDVVDIDGAVDMAANLTLSTASQIYFNRGAGISALDYEDGTSAAIFINAASTSNYFQPLIGVGEGTGTFTAAISSFDSGGAAAQGLAFHTGDTNAITERFRIASDGAATFTGAITANAGVVVDNITIDGTQIDLSSGDLTLDVAGSIILDADSDGRTFFYDGGTEYGIVGKSSNSLFLKSSISDGDILFQGNDNGSAITALTLDMSDGGSARFAHDISLIDSGQILLGAGLDGRISSDGTNLNILANNGDLTLDVAGDIILDADGGSLIFRDGGTTIAQFDNSSSDLQIISMVSDKDIIFRGNDNGSFVNALTLDMSAAGAATFNSNVTSNAALIATSGVYTNNGIIYGNDTGIQLKDNGARELATFHDTGLGTSNVAMGVNAGNSIESGGTGNVAVGDEAGTAITTGDYNTALGFYALYTEDTASKSTAVGTSALQVQNAGTVDAFNTAVGFAAGVAVTTGIKNTFIGGLAGDATDDGGENVAIGYQALSANCGDENTACGSIALAVATGIHNTAVGRAAGFEITSGNNCVAIGADALRTGSPGGAVTTGSNILGLGDESISAAHIQVDWTVASDARDKTDFTALDLGLDFVKDLQPVTYKWDKRSKYGDKTADNYDLTAQTPDGTHKEDWLDIGFKAQEVEALEIAAGYNKDNNTNLVSSYTDDGKQMGLQYSKFVPILVKAIQEQQALIEALTARIETLEG